MRGARSFREALGEAKGGIGISVRFRELSIAEGSGRGQAAMDTRLIFAAEESAITLRFGSYFGAKVA
jgi:hypothetical protein